MRDAVSSISDNTAANRYVIFVKNGTYEEIDIKTKDYVDIVGESKAGVILYCNGLSTDNSPSDYNWGGGDYANIPINTIPKAWKHLFIHMSNSTIKNMTLKVNQCKYVIHQDNESNEYDAIVENCTLIREEDYNDTAVTDLGLYYIVGVGARIGQFQRYYDCDFVSNIINAPSTYFTGAILWHNWRSGTKEAGMTVKNCTAFGCGFFANVNNLRTTGVYDLVDFIDCDADNSKSNVVLLTSTSSSAHPIVDGEYHIYCNLKGYTKLQSVMIDSLGVNYAKNSLSASAMKKVHVSASVLKGQPIDDTTGFVLNGNVSKGIATTTPFVVALENASLGDFCYCNKGDYFSGLCVADSYAVGDNIYINNGKFTKTVSGSSVGKVVEAINLSADGFVKIVKQ